VVQPAVGLETDLVKSVIVTTLRYVKVSAWCRLINLAMWAPVYLWLKPPLGVARNVWTIKISVLIAAVGVGYLALIAGLLGLIGLRWIRKCLRTWPTCCPVCLYPAENERCPECGVTTSTQERTDTWQKFKTWWSQKPTRAWRAYVVFSSIVAVLDLAPLYVLARSTNTIVGERCVYFITISMQFPAILTLNGSIGLLVHLRRAPIWPPRKS
jgi:hypothetical protein